MNFCAGSWRNWRQDADEMKHWEILYDESDVCLLSCGSMVETSLEVRDMLKRNGANCSLIVCCPEKPLDQELLRTAAAEHALLVTVEDHVEKDGLGAAVCAFLKDAGLEAETELAALPDEYAGAELTADILREAGLDAENLLHRIQARLIGIIR